MRLADYLETHGEAVLRQWEAFPASIQPGAPRWELRDHADKLLRHLIENLRHPPKENEPYTTGKIGRMHALERINQGYRLDELMEEYRALRVTVLEMWRGGEVWEDEVHFNAAIDEALKASVTTFYENLMQCRDQYLGILGHDLRNPLGAILMGAQALSTASPQEAKRIQRILNSARRMERMINDLLDLTRTKHGGGIPVVRAPMDLGDLCTQVVAEVQAYFPDAPLHCTTAGDTKGEFDHDRVFQLMSNLVVNAVQHGSPRHPVEILVQGEPSEVVITVHNEGVPISNTTAIFDPMVRRVTKDHPSSGLGMGLFIAKQVALSHGGDIDVVSGPETGTTFTVHLPRTELDTRLELRQASV